MLINQFIKRNIWDKKRKYLYTLFLKNFQKTLPPCSKYGFGHMYPIFKKQQDRWTDRWIEVHIEVVLT